MKKAEVFRVKELESVVSFLKVLWIHWFTWNDASNGDSGQWQSVNRDGNEWIFVIKSRRPFTRIYKQLRSWRNDTRMLIFFRNGAFRYDETPLALKNSRAKESFGSIRMWDANTSHYWLFWRKNLDCQNVEKILVFLNLNLNLTSVCYWQ